MGLTASLLRFGYVCPRPLIVTVPGCTQTRLAVEAALRRRGGRSAESAADADTLVVCGPATGTLAEAAERVWQQLPVPRARVALSVPADAETALDAALAQLRELAAQRRSAESATSSVGSHREREQQMADSDDDMMMPGGLAMASEEPDRDGLQLSQLHVQLGPVLAYWPAGMALRLAIQGDVVQQADYLTFGLDDPAGADKARFWDACALAVSGGEPVSPQVAGRRVAAAHWDSASRLLAVAGWWSAERSATALRDATLAAEPTGALRRQAARLTRRVRGSRTLCWLLRDVGTVRPDDDLARLLAGPASRAGGDAYDRLLTWLVEAERALAGDVDVAEGPRGPVDGSPLAAGTLEALIRLVVGTDLAMTRLIVASLDPDLDQLVGAPVGGLRG